LLLKSRILYAASAMIAGFFAIVAAQSLPPAPENLRILTGVASKPKPPTPIPECVVPAAVGGAHGFFDALVRRAEHHCNWSLRSQEQLQSLVNSGLDATKYWTYNPSSDTHPHRQDAAKFVKPQHDRYHECTTVYGKVRFTGTAGAVVPKGTMLTRRSDGATYRTNVAATIGPEGTTALVRIDAANPNTYQAAAPAGTALDVAAVTGVTSTTAVEPKNDVIVRCADSMPIQYQLRMPLGNVKEDSLLVTWDWYYTPDWRENVGGLSSYKMFKVQPGWTMLAELRSRTSHSLSVGAHKENPGSKLGAEGRTSLIPFEPTGLGALPALGFDIHHSVWTRYWVEIKPHRPADEFTEWAALVCKPGQANNPCTGAGGRQIAPNPEPVHAGRWHMVSVWIADENREPVPVLYRAPISWPLVRREYEGMTRFDFELNTSDKPIAAEGPLTGYGRNVVVLRNYKLPSVPLTDTVIFKKPLR
jgi:hypothetical protein